MKAHLDKLAAERKAKEEEKERKQQEKERKAEEKKQKAREKLERKQERTAKAAAKAKAKQKQATRKRKRANSSGSDAPPAKSAKSAKARDASARNASATESSASDDSSSSDDEQDSAGSSDDENMPDASDDDEGPDAERSELVEGAMLIVRAPPDHEHRFLVAEALEQPANDSPQTEFSVHWYVAKSEFASYEPANDPSSKKKQKWTSQLERGAVMVIFDSLNADQTVPSRVRKLFESDLPIRARKKR